MMRQNRRGFSLVEMVVSMAVLAIVMSLAAMEFKDVIYAHLFDTSHLSVEQQARVAMQKVDEITRQASVIDPGLTSSPGPAVLQPASTPGPRLQFTQVSTLQNLETAGGVPVLCYNLVTIALGPVNTVQANQLLEDIQPVPNSAPCGDETQTPLLLARNVRNFTVSNAADFQGYQVDITIFNSDDAQIDQRAGAVYHIGSIISPLQFGKAH